MTGARFDNRFRGLVQIRSNPFDAGQFVIQRGTRAEATDNAAHQAGRFARFGPSGFAPARAEAVNAGR